MAVAEGWHVYLLRCADGSLYAGVSADLPRRLRQHNGELRGGARYTRSRRPVELLWSEPAASRAAAQAREAALRKLSARAKLELATAAACEAVPRDDPQA